MGAVISIPSVVSVAMKKLLNMLRSNGNGPLIAAEKFSHRNSRGNQFGGRSYACSALFSAVTIMKRNGASMPSAPMLRTTTDTTAAGRTRVRAGRSRTAIALLIVDPRSADAELDERGGENDEEQRDRDGRGVPDLEVGEGLFRQVHHDAAGRVARAAVGQDDDRLVDLEGADHRDGDVEEDGLRDH